MSVNCFWSRLFQHFKQDYDRPISESDINAIIRKYTSLPEEDRQVLQALRSALTHSQYRHALSDVELTIHLDKTRDDYVLRSGKGKNKILAHRDGDDKVEIQLYGETLICKLKGFGDRVLAELEKLFMQMLEILVKGAAVKYLAM